MRIISGKYKGRRIQAPKKLPVRPTTDMAKEGLFNILNNTYFFEDLVVLDLFAGTGNISYEFASRGAKRVVSVDADFGCVKFIQDTATALNLAIEPIKSDVFKYLGRNSIAFDIIFADPPYNLAEEKFSQIADLVFEHLLLREDGVLILEHSKHMDLSQVKNFVHSRKYGGSVFSFFKSHEE